MRLLTRSFVVAAASVVLVGSTACGPEIDLAKSVQLVDIQSGYYDMGIINGKTKMVPEATLRVKNVSNRSLPVTGFQISSLYWLVGDDGMKDENLVTHLVARDLAPGATSDPIVLRANFGFTLDVPRSEAFQNSYFKDFTMKVFGKINGRIAKLGELTVERKILTKDASLLSKDGTSPTK